MLPIAALFAVVSGLTATPRPARLLVVQELRTCRSAQLAVGVPLESPPGSLSEIVRIDVLTAARSGRPLGLLYRLRNGADFFGAASGATRDPATFDALVLFLRSATTGSTALTQQAVLDGGYSLEPVLIDLRAFAALGFTRTDCAAVRVL